MDYLYHKDSRWLDIQTACPRCKHRLLREVLKDGTPTRHFACKRPGCTWTSYDENVDWILSHLRNKPELQQRTEK